MARRNARGVTSTATRSREGEKSSATWVDLEVATSLPGFGRGEGGVGFYRIEVFLCIHYRPGYLYTRYRRYPATGSQLSCYASMDPFARRFTCHAMSRAQSLRIADSKNHSFDALVYRDGMLFLLRSFQRW